MKKNFLLLLFLASFLNADFSAPYLQDKVDFWTKVYTLWDSNQVIFSDSINPKIIYHVMDLPKIPNEISAPKFSKEVSLKKEQIKKIIDHLQFKTELNNYDEKLYESIKEVLKNVDFDDVKLSDQVRNQSGLKSQFELGLKLSGSYMHEMKAMLESMNMPQELLALVFVESLGHLHVVSHASRSEGAHV